MRFRLFLAIVALSAALFAVFTPIQIQPIKIQALNIEDIIIGEDVTGTSLSENSIAAGGFVFDSSASMPLDPGFFKPEIYTLSQSQMVMLSSTMPPSRMEVVRQTQSTKDELALIYNFDSSNYTRVDIHKVNGAALQQVSTKSFAWSQYDTGIFSAISAVNGKTLLAGRYRTTSTSKPMLIEMAYSGGSNFLSSVNLSLSTNSALADIDATFATSASGKDYAMVVDEAGGGSHHTGLLFRTYTGAMSYKTFTKDYITDEHYHVRGGKFISSSKYGFAFVGASMRATDIYLYDSAGGLFSARAMKAIKTTTGKNIMVSGTVAADLDSDGQDELLIAGGYDTYGNFMKYSDVVQVYKYESGNLVLKGERLNSTGGLSWALAADAYDIDADGKKEVVTFDWAATGPGSYAITKGVANVYEYSGSGLTHSSSADFTTVAPTSSNCYDPRRARFGDFDGDDKREIAVDVEHKMGYTTGRRVIILELAKDTSGPSITIIKPANSTIKASGSMDVEFTAGDNSGIKDGSVKFRLKGTGYDSGLKSGDLTTGSGGKTRTLKATIPIGSLSAGNYTLTAYASDEGMNENSNSKALKLTSQISIGGLHLDLIPLANFTNGSSNASNATTPEPETTPELEAETSPSPEPEAIVEADGGEGDSGTVPSSEISTADSSSGDSGTAGTQNASGTSGSQSGSPGSGTAAGTQTGASTADKLITELEVKITVAKQQGADTSAAEQSLTAAKAAQQAGNAVNAALEAQKGVAQVDSQLGKAGAASTGADYTPYYIVAGAIIVLGGAYLLLARKPVK